MIPIEALAQRITVEGIVTDSNGEPIIGATVIEKGNKTNGVVTDLDGKFSITVSEKKKGTCYYLYRNETSRSCISAW